MELEPYKQPISVAMAVASMVLMVLGVGGRGGAPVPWLVPMLQWPFGVVWLGLLFATLGAACMVVFVPVDLLVRIDDAGAEERVRVALRPARYAPLHADRFAALVRAEGGNPP